MWNLIKSDPILKAIFVIVLGIFSFSFAFSIMFGSGQSGMEHGSASGGYSAATGLGQIIILLSKVLIIVIIIALIIAAIKFIQKHIIGSEPIKGIENFKNKPLSAILLGVIGILVLLFMIIPIFHTNTGNNMMSPSINYSYNNYGFGITALLASIVRLITAISFIGLIVGLTMYFRSQYFTADKAPSQVSKDLCSKCGIELKATWKCCPSCGSERQAKEKNNDELKITLEDNGVN